MEVGGSALDEIAYPYKPKPGKMLIVVVVFFGAGALLLGHEALTNDRGLILNGIIHFDTQGATIFYWCVAGVSAAFTACGLMATLFGLFSNQSLSLSETEPSSRLRSTSLPWKIPSCRFPALSGSNSSPCGICIFSASITVTGSLLSRRRSCRTRPRSASFASALPNIASTHLTEIAGQGTGGPRMVSGFGGLRPVRFGWNRAHEPRLDRWADAIGRVPISRPIILYPRSFS